MVTEACVGDSLFIIELMSWLTNLVNACEEFNSLSLI